MPNHSIVFLMYHELEIPGRDLCQAAPGYARYVLPEGIFRAQMDHLKDGGWRGLNVSQALTFPQGPNVAITFDDGCETDLLRAAPILLQAGFSATFFITCGRLGTAGYLSASQLRGLSAEGFEIGCHSMTHPYLTDLDEAGLRYEIYEAKSQLEQIIGSPVNHFSCPGGRYDHRVITMARSAGYRTLATSDIRANSPRTNVFALGRVAMLRDFTLSTFGAICEGRLLSRMRAQSMLRETARRILGNTLYDNIRDSLLHRAHPLR
jgi:peptidoglycan/xylan/chitin deacetylase (PgdA/CDA1 family)